MVKPLFLICSIYLISSFNNVALAINVNLSCKLNETIIMNSNLETLTRDGDTIYLNLEKETLDKPKKDFVTNKFIINEKLNVAIDGLPLYSTNLIAYLGGWSSLKKLEMAKISDKEISIKAQSTYQKGTWHITLNRYSGFLSVNNTYEKNSNTQYSMISYDGKCSKLNKKKFYNK